MKTFGCGVGVGCHDAAAGTVVDCFIVPTCAAWGSAKCTAADRRGPLKQSRAVKGPRCQLRAGL